MKATSRKFLRRRKKIKDDFVFPTREVTDDALNIWRNLPHIVKQDPSFAVIRQEHEKLHGQLLEEQDPLPNNEQHQENNELTNINVVCDSDDTRPLENDKRITHGDTHGSHAFKSDAEHTAGRTKVVAWYHRIKIAALVLVWIFFTYLLMSYDEKEIERRQMAVLPFETKDFTLHETPLGPRIGIYLKGAFYEDHDRNASNFLNVYLDLIDGLDDSENVTTIHSIAIVDAQEIDHVEETTREIVFNIGDEAFAKVQNVEAILRVQMYTNIEKGLPLLFAYDPSPIDKDVSVICAAVVLLGLYVLIVWDVVHRTFAAIVASTLALSVLAVLHQKPSMEEITKGRVWPLINCLAFFTAILSAFLDNVTTILLMTPVTIRLSEVMGLNPIPILMTMVIYSNVGGALTPVGDPPNVIITSNPYVVNSGINFLNVTAHMGAGIIFVMLQTYLQIRFKYRNMDDLRFTEPRGIECITK